MHNAFARRATRWAVPRFLVILNLLLSVSRIENQFENIACAC